ncbi:hypothetical protein ACFPA8_13915 [Streptomyces ovatisporus]|uniref:Secreted protein n=1 Tax=Streptomyces ovatisporus TaxID=1128682 RepID=A0ABV9A6J8_9ACTN
MGSLRNPIGPLPSSIYWRRRAVALAILALLVLLVVWALGLGGRGSHDEGKGDGGKVPASSITPGPTDPGPTVGERPGGRDESDEGGTSDGGSGDDGGENGGDGASGGGGDGGSGWEPGRSGAGGTDGGDSAGGGSTGSGGGAAVPAGSELPGCKGSDVTVSLRSVHKDYAEGEKPRFELTVKNKRGTACKLDLGRTATVVTIKNSDDKKIWASDDCAREAKPALFQLPGSGSATHTFTWYRKAGSADCGTPPEGSAKPGEYEIEVDLAGVEKVDASFELKD